MKCWKDWYSSKRRHFTWGSPLWFGMSGSVWVLAHCSLVSRESGCKLGLLMISRFNWACLFLDRFPASLPEASGLVKLTCLFYALVCAGFWGEVFNAYAHDIPNVSIPVRRQLIGTTWILFHWRSCSIATRAFQCGCPGVPWWQLTKECWHISHSWNSPLLPIWWQFPRTISLLQRSTCSQVDESRQEYSWQLTRDTAEGLTGCRFTCNQTTQGSQYFGSAWLTIPKLSRHGFVIRALYLSA